MFSVRIILAIILVLIIYKVIITTRILTPFSAAAPTLQTFNQVTDQRYVDTIHLKMDEKDLKTLENEERYLSTEKYLSFSFRTSLKPASGVNANESTNWTLLLTVNEAFFDFFQNWFWYFKKLDIHLPITIIADDDEVYEQLISACNYCSVFRSDLNVNGAQEYNGQWYKVLVSMRPKHILRMLKSGTDVIYADIDSVWLQNPLPFLDTDVDIAVQEETATSLCTGFMAIRSNANTINLVQQWHDLLVKSPQLNQGPFNKLLQQNKRTVSYVALNTLYFPSGRRYFNIYSEEQRSNAVVVHNNWIVGHDPKKRRFQRFNLWHV